MQKKDPKYYDLKEETAWTMEQFKLDFIFNSSIFYSCFHFVVIMSIKILHQIKILKKIGF